MTTVLITGMSGVLGRYLALSAPPEWRVVGTFNHNPLPAPHIAYHIDLSEDRAENVRALGELIAAEEPDLIIHAASPSQLECAERPQYAEEAIVGGTQRLLDARSNFCPRSRLIFLSHYAVYGQGTSGDGLILESDIKSPTSEIGKAKLQAEQMVQETENIAMIRPSWIFGVGWPGGRMNFAQHIYDALRAGRWFPVENKLIAQPIFAGDLARIVWQIAFMSEIREVNVGGLELMSVRDFARLAAKIWGYSPNRITEKSASSDIERVVFLMMRLYSAGLIPNEIGNSLIKMKDDLIV